MKPTSPRVFLALLAGLFLALPARAHLPNESSLVLSVDEENFAAFVSLSLPSAAALLPADAAPLSSATLDQNRAALLASAPRVFLLLDDRGAPLAPQRVLVSLRDEHEVRFHFLFPLSVQPARVRMSLLTALPGGAFCSVADLRLKTPGRGALTASAPEFLLSAPTP